ncbi:hypothetical protein CMI37_19560 [Candidatus Pacearchaeota archaeon]|nr:hypothetical protein [Candidatus Pacearchaeota archaeon]
MKHPSLWFKQKGKCFYCGTAMIRNNNRRNSGKYATIDHVIPKAQGGTSEKHNVVYSCRRCNLEKGDKLPAGWYVASR